MAKEKYIAVSELKKAVLRADTTEDDKLAWLRRINAMAGADVCPNVLLCRDCEHREKDADRCDKTYYWCDYLKQFVMLGDYCSWGVDMREGDNG